MVTASFETKPDDISVLAQENKKQLTMFTCVPIGTVRSRWVVQAIALNPPKKIQVSPR